MRLTVLQWNCLYEEDPARVAEAIQGLNPDIVCLQELTQGYHSEIFDTGAYLAQRLGYEAHCVYGQMMLPNGQPAQLGNGILSRWPIVARRQLIQPGEERFYLTAELKVEGRQLTVSTTHLPFNPEFRTTPLRRRMTEEILAEASRITGPYLLAGDFNAVPRSSIIRRLRSALHDAGPNDRFKTWATRPFRIGERTYEGLKWRLDYIFYKEIACRGSQIIHTEVSDHRPIWAEFEF